MFRRICNALHSPHALSAAVKGHTGVESQSCQTETNAIWIPDNRSGRNQLHPKNRANGILTVRLLTTRCLPEPQSLQRSCHPNCATNSALRACLLPFAPSFPGRMKEWGKAYTGSVMLGKSFFVRRPTLQGRRPMASTPFAGLAIRQRPAKPVSWDRHNRGRSRPGGQLGSQQACVRSGIPPLSSCRSGTNRLQLVESHHSPSQPSCDISHLAGAERVTVRAPHSRLPSEGVRGFTIRPRTG